VHSMRSATYVHAGEQLTCRGCHESRHQAPKGATTIPKAFSRAPSMLVTEVPSGAVPFNFHVLVKPAFERTCLPCHQKMQSEGKKTGPLECSYEKWRSFAWCNTAPRDIGGGACMGSRTIPGHYGAHASRLGQALLNPTHQEARTKGLISDEDFRRMVLWVDCNSAQFGSVYSKDHVARQLRGEVVNPLVDFDPANPLGLEIAPSGTSEIPGPTPRGNHHETD